MGVYTSWCISHLMAKGPGCRGTAASFIRSESSRFVIHSFREGNTRTQFAFFTQLCAEVGYRLGTDVFQARGPLRDAFVQARFHSQDLGSNAGLASVLDQAITVAPRRPGSTDASRSAARLRIVDAPPWPS